MTFEEYAKDYLQQRGMFPTQALAVLEKFKAAKEAESMIGRWQENIEDYPGVLLIGITLTLNSCALEWIDENLPLAWYRPLFEKR